MMRTELGDLNLPGRQLFSNALPESTWSENARCSEVPGIGFGRTVHSEKELLGLRLGAGASTADSYRSVNIGRCF